MLSLPARQSAAGSPTAGRPPASRSTPASQRSHPTRDASGAGVAAAAALALLTIASAAGLERVFDGHSWVGPVLITAVVVHGVCLASRRWKLPIWLSIPLGMLAVVIVASWTVLGYTTRYGIPTARTFSDAITGLSHVQTDIATTVVPVRVTVGFALLVVGGTAAVAVLGDWAAFSRRSALYGAAPAFGFFIVCCVLGVGSGRQWAVALEVTALMMFLLAHTASVARGGQSWFGGRRGKSVRWGATSGSVLAAAGLLTALLITPAIKGSDGHGLLGWHTSLSGNGGAPREVANPIVDLETRLIDETQTPVFTVRSPVASYWRLTALNTFTGVDWISTYVYRGFHDRLPGVGAVPTGTRTISETFRVQNLDSVWLPVAFTPVSVDGAQGVSYDPASGSLITSHGDSNGLDYQVESYQYLATLNQSELEAAPPVHNDSSLAPYLSLPSSVPPNVYALAQQIITDAGATTEYDKAIALQNYLTGPEFTYSLRPPDDGYGIDSLTNFLFYTRSGYCQQFAGAYAVLARAVGLPTRLAFGFATGQRVSTDSYQVTDGDAHTWPEVYFGPQFGWLPFEPTKGFTDPIATNYAGPGSRNSSGEGPTGNIDAPAPHSGTAKGTQGGTHPSPPTTLATPGTAAPTSKSSNGPNPGWVLVFVLLGLVAWVAVNTTARRLRWILRRRRARGDPAGQILAEWAMIRDLLAWWGVRSRDAETPNELSRRAAMSMGPLLRERSPWLPGGLSRLAGLACEASFAPEVPSGRPAEASEVAREVHQRMVRAAGSKLLLLWALVPMPGRWAPSSEPTDS